MKKNLPHKNVYTRLVASKIHGVGVMAVQNIKKGTHIFYGDEDTKMVWVEKDKLKGLPKEIKKMYEDFCVIVDRKGKKLYGCPVNFNQMTISWYLNHSNAPNVACDKKYVFYALRNVEKGEELTVDYTLYSL